MAASFISASSQSLLNSVSPITAVPFTVGCWVFPTSTASQQVAWAITDPAVSTSYFMLQNKIGTWTLSCDDGAGVADASSAAAAVNVWVFIVCRCISATNRRMAILNKEGSTSHISNSTSRTPTNINRMALGILSGPETLGFNGRIAEFWYTNTNIQADGLQLQDSLLRQLAYGGPFSVPHIAKDIIEYRALRTHHDSLGGRIGEVYNGKFGRQNWANTGGVTIGPHCPLPYWYKKPIVNQRVMPF